MPATPRNPDRHENPGVLARPAKTLKEQAKRVLAEQGWTMNEFLIACLAALVRNPQGMLRRLGAHRPPRRRGRPRRSG